MTTINRQQYDQLLTRRESARHCPKRLKKLNRKFALGRRPASGVPNQPIEDRRPLLTILVLGALGLALGWRFCFRNFG